MSNPYDQDPNRDPAQNPRDPANPYQDPAQPPPQDPSQDPWSTSSQNPYQDPPRYPYQSPGQDPHQMQDPYQGQYAGGGAPPQPHPKGTTVLVLGIVGLFICGIVLGPIALLQGNKALQEIDANPGAYTNRQQVVIGRVLGIVAIAVWAVGIVARLVVGMGSSAR